MKEIALAQTAEKLSVNAQILSPLLRRIMRKESKMRPKTDFACQHCPNALWFIQNREELTCFCKLMNLMVWTSTQKNVISACDGIFQASEKD